MIGRASGRLDTEALPSGARMTRTVDGPGAETALKRTLRDRRLRRQAMRYVVVGIGGYCVQIGSFALLRHAAGMPPVPAAVIAGLLALCNNFVLNRYWTFDAGHANAVRQAVFFSGISAVFFATQVLILRLLIDIGVPDVAAEAASVIAVVPMNFAAQRRLTFRA
jgi:putative flippase GtrA